MFWKTPRTIHLYILYGYNQTGLSALLDLPDVIRYLPQIDTVNTHGAKKAEHSTIQGLINACFQLGALFTVGRIKLGAGVGQLSVIVSLWQAESSTTGSRGRKVITAGIFICMGFLLSSWINLGWRVSLAIPVLLSSIICISIFTFPESPRWLVQKYRITDATETLAKLNGMSSKDEQVQYEICQIRDSLEVGPKVSIKDVFSRNDQNRLLYRFTLCLAIQILQQLVSGKLISIYTTSIFENNLHLQGDIPAIVAASSLTWKFLCSFIAFSFAVGRLGRQWLFVLTGTGMSMCMVAMAAATSFSASNHAASIVAAVFIFIFNFFYPIGFLGEIFCTALRLPLPSYERPCPPYRPRIIDSGTLSSPWDNTIHQIPYPQEHNVRHSGTKNDVISASR
ncbi:hypothetical protein BDV33DRAFT_190718 [Aspergillus novoparasiticus]|uniref:Sugar transporter n=1 Tax=Aspergillus novoparasiticus TaxID=986946 RepID=A0A5N6EUF4_9EURO|nr:hypothetical protein BDV33DRAFT_190718 [Aspergillus novoparasiticus]